MMNSICDLILKRNFECFSGVYQNGKSGKLDISTNSLIGQMGDYVVGTKYCYWLFEQQPEVVVLHHSFILKMNKMTEIFRVHITLSFNY